MHYIEKRLAINDYSIEIDNSLVDFLIVILWSISSVLAVILVYKYVEFLLYCMIGSMAVSLLVMIFSHKIRLGKRIIILSNISHIETYPYDSFNEISIFYSGSLTTYFPKASADIQPEKFFLIYQIYPDTIIGIAPIDSEAALKVL